VNAPGDSDKPDGLTSAGEKAWAIIEAWRQKRGLTYSGGCRTYYSPAEWCARNERYGTSSLLVVVHDGGDLSASGEHGMSILDRDHELSETLAAAGLYLECCTHWYHAVYLI